MNNFPIWSRDWFYLCIMRHWVISSVIFLISAPQILGAIYCLGIPQNARLRKLFFVLLAGASFSISYTLFSLISSAPKYLGLIGLAIAFLPAIYSWKYYHDRLSSYVLVVFSGLLTLYVQVTLFYLSYLHYFLAPEFSEKPVSSIIKHSRMLTGIEIGLSFVLIYIGLLVFIMNNPKKGLMKLNE